MKSAMPFRLAVFDMDDTLLGPTKEVSPENLAAVKRLREAGVEVVIASGRHHSSVMRYEESLGLAGWVISAGGAVVKHSVTEELLYEVTVPHELAVELFRRGQEIGLSLIGYHRTGIYCDKQTDWTYLYKRKTGQVPVTDMHLLMESGLQKLIWFFYPERIAEFTPQMQAEFAGRLYVVNTEHEMLEFLSVDANKALAVQALAKRLGIAREEIIAFGDGNNDVPLLEWAGMSVAMAHGRESAKKAAKRVSPVGAPETAVARALEEILGQD